MSDVTIPSYRVPRESRGGVPVRMLLVAGGLLGGIAVAGAVAWGVGRVGGGAGPRGVPVIEPDSRPIKVRPENPGGLVVPNTDQLVLEPPAVRRAAEREQGASARLAPVPEAPQLDLLRRAAAPPAAPVAVPPPEPLRGVEAEPAAPVGTQLGAAAPALPRPVAETAAPSLPRPVAEPAVPATPAPPATGRLQVQLGALASEEAARAEWARLQRRVPALAGRQPQVLRVDRGAEQPPLWRLRAGGIADAEAGRALCDAVRGAGGACILLPPARGG